MAFYQQDCYKSVEKNWPGGYQVHKVNIEAAHELPLVSVVNRDSTGVPRCHYEAPLSLAHPCQC